MGERTYTLGFVSLSVIVVFWTAARIADQPRSAAAAFVAVGEEKDVEDDPWAVTDIPERPLSVAEPITQLEGNSEDPDPQPKQVSPRTPLSKVLQQAWRQATWSQLTYEAAITAFAIVYIVNIVIGRRKNAQLARSWGQTFCLPGGVLDRNFAQIGTGKGA